MPGHTHHHSPFNFPLAFAYCYYFLISSKCFSFQLGFPGVIRERERGKSYHQQEQVMDLETPKIHLMSSLPIHIYIPYSSTGTKQQ